MKKGFTLVELIGVIIILGIISLITFPTIDKSIKNSKEQALERIIDSIEEAAYNYSVENDIGYSTEYESIELFDLVSTGFLKENIINPVTDKKMQGCIFYRWYEPNKQYIFEYNEECKKPDTEPEVAISYDKELINSNGWAKENVAVTITGNGEVKYCLSSTECEPNEVIETGNNTKFITIDGINHVCAITSNSLGSSEKKCEIIKLDKTAPTINGLSKITVNKGELIDLSDGVTASDSLSGIEGSLSYSPTSVSNTTVGVTKVTYKVKDQAGNEKSATREVEVLGNAPTITFSSTGTFNSNGWAKSNFYVKAAVTDDSGKGIKSIKWCSTIGTSCTPSTTTESVNVLVSKESASNKICVQAIDNNNKTTTKCSGNYKLDKTAPTISGLSKLTVDKGNTISLSSGVTAKDSLSGIDGTFSYTPTSVSNTTVGTTTVTYKVKDQAGNEKSATREVEVLGNAPTITFSSTGTFNSNGWAKSNFYVKAAVTDDSGKGIKSIKWCSTIGTSCTPSTTTESVNVLVSKESASNKICVEAIDNNNKTTTKCSSNYKLDKTMPSIEGTADKVIQKGETINLSTGVTVSDTLSGVEGTFSYSPTSVSTTVTGTTKVTYKVKDKAGNERTVIRNIIVDAEAPTIVYNLVNPSSINSNGWAKENFYVRATITDNSGSGIKVAKSCTVNSSSECVPTADISGTTKDFYIEVEGNNRLCIEVTDNNNKTTKICSDTYKLDKTVPVVGTASFSGTMGSNGWYTSDVTVNVVNGNDSLSGHLSTTSNTSKITTNSTGTTVIITTTDLAGNSASRSYTIKLDKNNPTAPSITGGSTTWVSTSRTISVSGDSSSTSGIAYYQYYISTSSTGQIGGNWTNLSNGVKSINITTNGIKYVYFRAINNAGKEGNISSAQTVKIDTTQPALQAKASNTTVFQGTSVDPINYFTITSNYNNSLSGGTTTCSVDGTTITNMNILANGTYTLTCSINTGTGKTATASTTIYITYNVTTVSNSTNAYTYLKIPSSDNSPTEMHINSCNEQGINTDIYIYKKIKKGDTIRVTYSAKTYGSYYRDLLDNQHSDSILVRSVQTIDIFTIKFTARYNTDYYYISFRKSDSTSNSIYGTVYIHEVTVNGEKIL